MKKKIITVLIIVLLLAAAVCGGVIWNNNRVEAAEDANIDNIQNQKPEVTDTNDSAASIMDFESLKRKNSDTIAWLTVDSTMIDYPVVQYKDNDYYLTHDIEKRYNRNGALFLDYRTNPEFTDFNSVIYGHHMRSGRMFQNLIKFKEKKYFDSHRTGRIYIEGATYEIEFFAAGVTTSGSDYYAYAFASPADKTAHIDMIRKTAMYFREIDVNENDRLITLSTCSHEFKNARTFIVGRLIYQ